MALWERLRARARDQQYQHKVNCTYKYCVYACCGGVGNPDKSFIIFFQHEMVRNQSCATDVPRNRFLKHRTVAPTDFRPLSTPVIIWSPIHVVPFTGRRGHTYRRRDVETAVVPRCFLVVGGSENRGGGNVGKWRGHRR